MKRIFVTIPVKEHHRTLLQNAAPGCEFIYAGEDGISPEDVADADIIVGKVPIPMLKQCKHLEFLQLNSAGASSSPRRACCPKVPRWLAQRALTGSPYQNICSARCSP